MLYVLICAGEGDTEAVFLAQGASIEALRHLVGTALQQEIDDFPLPWSEGNQGYKSARRQALLTMLAGDEPPPGRRVLPPVEPLYEQWTLVITDGTEAFLRY